MSNVDIEETQKFAKLSADWWNPKGFCRPLHDLNPIRLQFITDRCFLEKKRVIDVGCGAGILSESLCKRGALVTGIDAASEVIEVAKNHAKENHLESIHYEVALAESYAEANPESFDVLTCMELLEHVPDPLSLIKACAQLIKPNGDLFFSTLNRNLKSYCLAILGAEYLLKILPKNTHSYEKFIKPSELAGGLNAANLQLLDLAGMHYNPFTHQAKLTSDVSVNYLVHAKRKSL